MYLNIRVDIFVLIWWNLFEVWGQFPAVCKSNLTSSLPAICCPIPTGFTQPCGGPGRGLCRDVSPAPEDLDLIPLTSRVLLDDRLAWPSRFFRSICICQGYFQGYACHQCKTGWTGPDCLTRRQPRLRRNVFQLSPVEQRQFRDRIALAKRTPMKEWLVINITDSSNGDPIELTKLKLVEPPSVYDYFVFIHLYASRSSLIVSDTNNPKCMAEEHLLDFAHKGPAFAPWHRAFMLYWELELSKLTVPQTDFLARRDGDDFAFPYWDWTGQQGCPICTNDLVGAPDPRTDSGRLDPRSPFSNWITFCPQRPGSNDCHICDPGFKWTNNPNHPLAGSQLWRKLSDPKLAPRFARLPDQFDMDKTLSTINYDTWPYRNGAGLSSFRDLLEGFANPKENRSSQPVTLAPVRVTTTIVNGTNVSTVKDLLDIYNTPVYMHNLVHSYFNGSWFDVSTSPNDPLFLLHHTFVDKIFELWIRKYRPGPEQYPTRNCPPGHNAFSAVVPFIPVIENVAFFVDSRNLGYDYDDYKAGTSVILPAENQNPNLATTEQTTSRTMLSPALIGLIVLCILLFLIVIGGIVAMVMIFKHRTHYYTAIDSTSFLEHPQLAVLDTWRKARFQNKAASQDDYRFSSNHPYYSQYGQIQQEKTRLLDAVE